jgi:hypothetical protein
MLALGYQLSAFSQTKSCWFDPFRVGQQLRSAVWLTADS